MPVIDSKLPHIGTTIFSLMSALAALTAEFRKVHQFSLFAVNAPMQHAIASYMADPQPYLELQAFYQRKRDGLQATRFKLLPADGTYFQCVDYREISDLPEIEFAQWLTKEIGVATILVSAFYEQARNSGIVRFCFAKKEETLKAALARLAKV